MSSRRQFLRLATTGLAYSVLLTNRAYSKMIDRQGLVLTEEALRIHRSALVFDGHNDLIDKMRKHGLLSFDNFDLLQNQPDFQTDIPRLLKGGVGAQFWVAEGSFSDSNKDRLSSSGYCLEDIELIHQMVKKYPEVFEMAYSSGDIIRIHNKGLIACLIGIEGGTAIENSLTVLDSFYRQGARYLTLTWGTTNDLADSANDLPKHGGLSELGEKVVLEMNRLGMLVDISHVSGDTMRDVLKISRAPVIASHSSSYALSATPRNVPDDVLEGISKNQGIIAVNFFPAFLTQEGAALDCGYWENLHVLEKDNRYDNVERIKILDKWDADHPTPMCSVEKVVDHIDHIVQTAGIDYVGLGSDFEGVPLLPDYLKDVSFFPYVTQSLLNRGYKEESIHKILGGNFVRVLKKAEEMADK
jgi:membrane dipeptidase